MTREEALKAMKSLQDNLGVDRSEENLTTEAATHEIRTETHSCVSETHGDLISRDDAREAIEKLMEIHFDRQVVLAKARDAIVSLPSADTDMSEYSDRLWKAAYERGKAEKHQLATDLISRSDTIKAMCLECDIDEKCDVWIEGTDQRCTDVEIVKGMPPADTDMSGYSDRLWKAAYERGKADGSRSTEDMDYCNNCPYISWDGDLISRNELLVSIDREDDSPWNTK